MPTYAGDSGALRRDEDMEPAAFVETLYPSVMGMATSEGRDARDEERLNAARRGEYWREPTTYPKPELETLSATARLEKQQDRIERMLRYLIPKLPATPAPKND